MRERWTALALFALVTAPSATATVLSSDFIEPAAQGPWAGSWVASSGLFMLGWFMRGT
jgi:hypothetical protein